MKKHGFVILIMALLLLAGVAIKCYYVSYTDTWERQHDVISFGADEGHAAYIEYIRDNGHLPDFDPREKWAFFQPPLHHIVSGKTMDVAEALGKDQKGIEESTQIPTCIYMILIMFMSLYMFAKANGMLKISYSNTASKVFTNGCITMLAIIAVHPMFTLLSGSINNDSLALFLSVLALVIAVAWYENPGYILTIILAVVIGLAMITKLTGGLVAVPIGILMVMRFLGFSEKNKSNAPGKLTLKGRLVLFFKQYLLKAIVFGIIVFPLGLSFSIWNKVKWNMPINYIPPVGENFSENITLFERLFSLKTESVYTYLTTRGDAYDEYSIPLALIKTSVFGEYNFSDVSRWMKPLTFIVFVSAVALILIALYATIYMVFSKKSKLDIKWKIILFGTWATYLLAYLYFAISHGNFSAQDFRYAAICILCEGIFAGLYVDSVKNKKVKYIITFVALIFAGASFMTYFLLGFKS